MKKLILSAFVLATMFSCQKSENSNQEIAQPEAVSAVTGRICGTQEVLARQLQEDPTLASRMQQIENFTQQHLNTASYKLLPNGSIQIPVVVNVLYRTTAENISTSQIQSQIDVLNKDFNGTNSDFGLVPSLFAGVKATVGITFTLDQVIRKATTKTSWGTADAMKKTAGILATLPTTKLNLWICTIGGGILGYAQFPGGASSTDGVAIDSRYFGTIGTATYPYNLGRTATHEIGHWMNLRHIWGDVTCGSDLVSDTPIAQTSNFGVPAFPKYSACSGGNPEMTMNYMDYTDDRGMYMFSNGQKSRMNTIFSVGGSRASFRNL